MIQHDEVPENNSLRAGATASQAWLRIKFMQSITNKKTT
jgi:hypothetical protein